LKRRVKREVNLARGGLGCHCKTVGFAPQGLFDGFDEVSGKWEDSFGGVRWVGGVVYWRGLIMV
jgi:hypothetical protein